MSSFMYANYDDDTQQSADPDKPNAALPQDANGNIIANVNHRTGLLASLLGLGGGAGEIAVATDFDALVRYTGVVGEAKAFYRQTLLSDAGNPAVSGATTPGGNLNAVVIYPVFDVDAYDDPYGVFTSTGQILIPAGVTRYEIQGTFVFAASTSGVSRRVTLQVETSVGSGSWGALSNITEKNRNTTYTVPVSFRFVSKVYGGGQTSLRLVVSDDSASGLVVTPIDFNGIGNPVTVKIYRD